MTSLPRMLRFDETLLLENNKQFLVSIDEVGRGSIYGSGFVTSSLFKSHNGVSTYQGKYNDSKQLNADNIKKASDFLMLLEQEEFYYNTLEVPCQAINSEFERGGDGALSRVFRKYCEKSIVKCLDDSPELNPDNTLILLDGNDATLQYAIMKYGYQVLSLPKADGKSATCAAASILAKRASNDHVANMPPEEVETYGIATNKGYGTKAHTIAIKHHGLSGNHRYFAK